MPPMPAHPLFPAEGDEPPPRVEKIHVSRDRADGKPEFHANMFDASELQDLSQIWNQFGGGSYELIAYAGGRYTKRRRVFFDGKKKPMNFDESGNSGTELPTAPIVPQDAGGMNMQTQTLFMLFKMMADQQSASQASLAQVMVAALGRPQPDPNAGFDRVLQVMQAQQAQQFELLTKVMSASSGGTGGHNPTAAMLDLVRQGIELGRASAGGGEESDDTKFIDAISEAAGAVMQGIGLAQQHQQMTQPQEQPPQPQEQPPQPQEQPPPQPPPQEQS